MDNDLTIADLRIESDADPLLPGTKLHWYRVDSVLGQGDYWLTYLASDLNLGRTVIITEYMPCEIAVRDTRGVIHPAAAEHGAEYKAGLACFLTDAQKLAGIRHQNIALALNAFEANNSAYIVVAHEQGKKAEHLFDGSTVAEKELLALVLPILDGLEAIHASGYIHRYIQPSNIIIRPDGSPVLTGFNPGGGALFNPASTLTKHFPSDFAPIELCFGDGELHGPWTDIFSLGATLYQAVVGVAPVAAIERSRMVVQGETDPLMSVLPVGQENYSDAFLKAIDHALRFLPTQRPLTVAAWRKELSGNDSLDIDFVIRPKSEHVAKLRDDVETLRAQEDHKRRVAEEERTVRKLLDLARTAISEHDLQTAQTRLDEAAGIAPTSEAVAHLREELKARETAVVQQRLVKETRHRQAEETANTFVALGRKALQANDIRMAEAHFDQAFVIRPESEQVVKLREDLETYKLRAQEDHKRRVAEEERTVKKLLDLARTAISEHDLQTAQTRLDEAAGIAPTSEAVAHLREELKARETAVVQQRLVEETRHRQAEETANTFVALGRKALQANDIRMAEAHFDQAFVIRPESEQVVKLREDLETYKLRAQEDHKRRVAEEERTVKKLLDLARTAISEHDLQTAQTRLDEAAGIAPTSEAVAHLREELKARETAVVQQRLVEETRHRQAEETANKVVALGRGRTGNQERLAVAGRPHGKIDSIPDRSLQPAGVPVNTPISNDRVGSAVDPSNETAGGSPPERNVRRRHRDKWLGYSAAIAGIVGLGLSLAWMGPGSFAFLYDAAEEWLSQNRVREEATETIPKPAAQVSIPEQLAPDGVAQGREDRAGKPTLFPPILDQRIGNLLEAAKADVEAGRITHPKGRNAIEKYQAVLALKPDLAEATEAIQDLLERLLSAARDALDGEQWDAAQSKLDEAATIAPASQRVAKLRDTLNVRKSVTLMQHVTAETKRLQAEEVVNKLVALGRKALDANDMRMAEAHLAQALVILPESDQVTKLRDELDTRKLKAQEALKSRAADRTNEEERTVKKLLELARKAINEHDLQTARIYVGQAATIRPDSSDVALVRDEIASHQAQPNAGSNAGQSSLGVPTRRQNTQSEKPTDAARLTIQEAASSRFRVQPGETVQFSTEYSLTLPARDKHAYVQATWALLKNGRRIGQTGMDYGFAKPGRNTAATELPLPSWTKSGQYTVEHRVQVGDSFDVARSHFVVAR